MDGRSRAARTPDRRADPPRFPRRRLRRHRDLHLPGDETAPRGMGSGRRHPRAQRLRCAAGASRRRRVLSGRTPALRRREHGTDRFPSGVERSVDEPARLCGSRARLPGAGCRAHRGWRRRADHRDAAGHPRDQGRGVRREECALPQVDAQSRSSPRCRSTSPVACCSGPTSPRCWRSSSCCTST